MGLCLRRNQGFLLESVYFWLSLGAGGRRGSIWSEAGGVTRTSEKRGENLYNNLHSKYIWLNLVKIYTPPPQGRGSIYAQNWLLGKNLSNLSIGPMIASCSFQTQHPKTVSMLEGQGKEEKGSYSPKG